jgi:hypothetical protein
MQLEQKPQPEVWIVEWGAISLPLGHPSRITCMTACHTEAEARAELADCQGQFDSHMFLTTPVARQQQELADAA